MSRVQTILNGGQSARVGNQPLLEEHNFEWDGRRINPGGVRGMSAKAAAPRRKKAIKRRYVGWLYGVRHKATVVNDKFDVSK